MPLRLNVGLSRKVGEATYGSRGACVNFEVEVEANLIREPDALKDRVRYLFGLAKAAVEEELSGSCNGQPAAKANGQEANGNGKHRTNGRVATASQVRAIHAIASRSRINLDGRLHDQFGVACPADLSISQASELIDALKSPVNGNGGRP